MRKIFYASILLMSLVLSGCTQEKAQVETYLNQLKASNDTMKATAQDMEKSMVGLQQEIASGNFDAEKVKTKIGEFADKMKVEKGKLEGLSVPEKAKVLHDTTIKQYEVAINVLGKTPAMIDIAKNMSEAAKKLRPAPGKKPDAALQKTVVGEMQGYQKQMMALQGEVGKLAQEGQDLDKTAKAEKKKLQDEFKIPAEPTPAAPNAGGPGPQGGPAPGGPGAAPAGGAPVAPAASATP